MHLSRTLLLTSFLSLSATAWAEDEGKNLTIDQLPAPVKATALEQANGVKISEVEEETKKGKTIYEIHFGDTEVTIDVNGKVLSSKVEKEDNDEDDKDDDKDEKGDHEHGHQDHGKKHHDEGDHGDENNPKKTKEN